jgi:hypothetical protein
MGTRIDQACTWLGNHELICLLLIAAICAAGIVGFCMWMARGIIPDEDEHKTNSVG